MKSLNFNVSSIDQACAIIKSGGVIACPSESVYGLSCDPFNTKALDKLLDLKKRDYKKGLILVAGDLSLLDNIIKPLSNMQKDLINKSNLHSSDISQATSYLVPALDNALPYQITGSKENTNNKVVIRLSSHPVICELTKLLKHPIVSTSANLSNNPPCESESEIKDVFNDLLDAIILKSDESNKDGIDPSCWGYKPSKIIDVISGNILRD